VCGPPAMGSAAAEEELAEGVEDFEVEVELEDDDNDDDDDDTAEATRDGGAHEHGERADDTAEVEEEVSIDEATEQLGAADMDEPERDEEGDPNTARIRHDVCLNSNDSTPDVFFSSGGVVSALSQGPFVHLLSGVRANTGAKKGRYLFEVEVLERVPHVQHELCVGFSVLGSSLFLNDGSPDSIGFGSDGTYFVAEPGQLSSLRRSGACQPLLSHRVLGILLNLDDAATGTISVFLDGVRAGRPQPIPSHLRGRALYPTINFRGMSLVVNFGQAGLQLQTLPFKCCLFAKMAEPHHEVAPAPLPSSGPKCEVVVPVGLPGGGVFDFAERFKEQRPEVLEISDRKMAAWCRASGCREPKDKSWRHTLLTLGKAAGRTCLVADIGANLLRAEREQLLKQFPAGCKKVAVVVMGEPSKSHKEWVHKTIQATHTAAKALSERRRLLAEASGIVLDEAAEPSMEPPTLDESVWSLPRGGGDKGELSEKELAQMYLRFCLPVEDEGFDEVQFELQDGSGFQAQPVADEAGRN